LCCDLVVATDRAFFACPELPLGVLPNTGLAKLPQVIGTRRAAELVLLRRRVTAREGYHLGLVNAVVPAGTEVEVALRFATSIVSEAPPTSIAEAKRSLRHHGAIDWDEVRDVLVRLDAEEWHEGLQAFVEKRPPSYDRFWTRRRTVNAGS
jgi:enoyl-CoA hydratase